MAAERAGDPLPAGRTKTQVIGDLLELAREKMALQGGPAKEEREARFTEAQIKEIEEQGRQRATAADIARSDLWDNSTAAQDRRFNQAIQSYDPNVRLLPGVPEAVRAYANSPKASIGMGFLGNISQIAKQYGLENLAFVGRQTILGQEFANRKAMVPIEAAAQVDVWRATTGSQVGAKVVPTPKTRDEFYSRITSLTSGQLQTIKAMHPDWVPRDKLDELISLGKAKDIIQKAGGETASLDKMITDSAVGLQNSYQGTGAKLGPGTRIWVDRLYQRIAKGEDPTAAANDIGNQFKAAMAKRKWTPDQTKKSLQLIYDAVSQGFGAK